MDIVELALAQQQLPNRHPWELARFEAVKHLISTKLRYSYESDGTILDIGSGDIFVTKKLAENFIKTKFLNVDTAYTSELIKRLSENLKDNILLYKSLENAASENHGFSNVVLLLDVIEHIDDDIGFLKYIQKSPLIGEESKFIITVPAFQSLFCEHDQLLKHYRRYTIKMLKQHIEYAGLKVVESGYFFTTLLLPRIMSVCLEKIIKPGNAKGVSNWKSGKIITHIFKTILVIDFKLNQIFKKIKLQFPGLSCYIICTK